MIIPTSIVFVFLLNCIDFVFSNAGKRSFSISDLLGTGDDTPKSKTEAIIEERTEFGRLILLVCTKTCARHRSEIPLWLKEFNQMNDYEGFETITYYYHTYRQPVTFINETEVLVFPNLLYFIGTNRYIFNGDINSKETLLSWIAELDRVNIKKPKTYNELNQILSSTSNCSNKYLIMADRPRCPQGSWPIVARVAQELGIQPVRLEFPLEKLSNVLLFKRLPIISETICHLTVLLHENSYTELGDDISPVIVSEWINALLPIEEGDCPALLETYWYPIEDELTELQQIYFSAEIEIAERNRRPAFVLVGLTGGIAVIVLACSIFWGLNGSAFAK